MDQINRKKSETYDKELRDAFGEYFKDIHQKDLFKWSFGQYAGGEGYANYEIPGMVLKRARRALREMAEDTAVVAFVPKDLSEVQAITAEIAHDIPNQYTMQYKPTTPQSAGGYRMVKVVAQAPGYKHFRVRTRSG